MPTEPPFLLVFVAVLLAGAAIPATAVLRSAARRAGRAELVVASAGLERLLIEAGAFAGVHSALTGNMFVACLEFALGGALVHVAHVVIALRIQGWQD